VVTHLSVEAARAACREAVCATRPARRRVRERGEPVRGGWRCRCRPRPSPRSLPGSLRRPVRSQGLTSSIRRKTPNGAPAEHVSRIPAAKSGHSAPTNPGSHGRHHPVATQPDRTTPTADTRWLVPQQLRVASADVEQARQGRFGGSGGTRTRGPASRSVMARSAHAANWSSMRSSPLVAFARSHACTVTSNSRIAKNWAPVIGPAGWSTGASSAPGCRSPRRWAAANSS
jgi:hypothetical protein